MLMKYRILLMGNTVEMAGGDIYTAVIWATVVPMNNGIKALLTLHCPHL